MWRWEEFRLQENKRERSVDAKPYSLKIILLIISKTVKMWKMLIECCTVHDQDAPVESAESQWILKTETVTTLSSLVKVIKEPWEAQFGVELQKNLYPSITVRLIRNCCHSFVPPLKTCMGRQRNICNAIYCYVTS